MIPESHEPISVTVGSDGDINRLLSLLDACRSQYLQIDAEVVVKYPDGRHVIVLTPKPVPRDRL